MIFEMKNAISRYYLGNDKILSICIMANCNMQLKRKLCNSVDIKEREREKKKTIIRIRNRTGCLLCERKSAGTLGLVGRQEFLSLDFTAAFRIRFHSRARLLEGRVKHLNGLCETSR